VPIGLCESGYRDADILLRKALGKRGASVFFAPLRPAVYAENYQDACSISDEIMGKKISVQSWNICGKIREVDQYLQQNTKLGKLFRESHPEWAFLRLNDGKPLKFKKKEKAGFTERLNILEKKCDNEVSAVVESFLKNHLRKDVQPDDVLDALVLALHAKRALKSKVHSFPEQIPIDAKGLPMAIYFT
jgi:predicted RNase H-like nuclease